MLTIVTFLWKQPKGYKTYFLPAHANILYKSVQRNLKVDHQFVVVTDDSRGFAPGIITVPLWKPPELPFEMDSFRPNCYTRLRMFSKDILKDLDLAVTPTKFVVLDLDLVITGDITEIVSTPANFFAWNKKYVKFQGALWGLTPGTRTHVWDEFIRNPADVRKRAENAGYYGSDQGVMSLLLANSERTVGKNEGIYHFAKDLRWEKTLPADCKIAIFHGSWSPWHPDMYNNYAWIREHWTENYEGSTNEGKTRGPKPLRQPRVQRI